MRAASSDASASCARRGDPLCAWGCACGRASALRCARRQHSTVWQPLHRDTICLSPVSSWSCATMDLITLAPVHPTRQRCMESRPQPRSACFAGAPGPRLQRAQQRAVQVQRQQRVNDLHRVLLKDEARVKVGHVGGHLRARGARSQRQRRAAALGRAQAGPQRTAGAACPARASSRPRRPPDALLLPSQRTRLRDSASANVRPSTRIGLASGQSGRSPQR